MFVRIMMGVKGFIEEVITDYWQTADDFENCPENVDGVHYKETRKWLWDNKNVDVISKAVRRDGSSVIVPDLPEDLFKNNTNVTNFSWCFYENQLTNIPENLFANNTNVTDFSRCFYENQLTNIPENLFANNTNVTTFSRCFYYNKLTNVPENLFANNKNVTNFIGCFFNNQLTNIPENLFANNKNVIYFGDCFRKNKLTNIPENLFANNTNVTDFHDCFYYNKLTNIPENLFANNKNVTDFSRCFYENKLTNITLRITSPNVSNVENMFGSNVTGTIYVLKGSKTAETFKNRESDDFPKVQIIETDNPATDPWPNEGEELPEMQDSIKPEIGDVKEGAKSFKVTVPGNPSGTLTSFVNDVEQNVQHDDDGSYNVILSMPLKSGGVVKATFAEVGKNPTSITKDVAVSETPDMQRSAMPSIGEVAAGSKTFKFNVLGSPEGEAEVFVNGVKQTSKREEDGTYTATAAKPLEVDDKVVVTFKEKDKLKTSARRISRKERIEDAVEESQILFANGSKEAVLYNADYPYHNIASKYYLATHKPSLATNEKFTPEATIRELKRLGTERIILIGNEDAIGKFQEKALKGMGYEVTRITGSNEEIIQTAINHDRKHFYNYDVFIEENSVPKWKEIGNSKYGALASPNMFRAKYSEEDPTGEKTNKVPCVVVSMAKPDIHEVSILPAVVYREFVNMGIETVFYAKKVYSDEKNSQRGDCEERDIKNIFADAGIELITYDRRNTVVDTIKQYEDKQKSVTSDRVQGGARAATAVEVSKVVYASGSKTVYLARSEDAGLFESAKRAAAVSSAPALVTEFNNVPQETLDEIKRLGAEKVVLVGNDEQISVWQQKAIEMMGYVTERVGGKDRYETSRLLSERAKAAGARSDKVANIVIAPGEDFPPKIE